MATRIASVGRFLPPGMAASTITAGHAGRAGNASAEFAGLLVYCAVLGWLLSLRLRAEYRGENLSEARQETAAGRSTVRAGWNVAGFSPTVAALFEKDLRYLLRNSTAYFTLLAPVFIVFVLSLGHGGPHAKTTDLPALQLDFLSPGRPLRDAPPRRSRLQQSGL